MVRLAGLTPTAVARKIQRSKSTSPSRQVLTTIGYLHHLIGFAVMLCNFLYPMGTTAVGNNINIMKTTF